MGPSLLLCADPAIGSDLVVHLGLGWAQPFIHMEDPLELPQGVGEGRGGNVCVILYFLPYPAPPVCCLLVKPCPSVSLEVAAHLC